jgi:hypothetical protein
VYLRSASQGFGRSAEVVTTMAIMIEEVEDLPLDFARFVAGRHGLDITQASDLIADWVQYYEPTQSHLTALRPERATEAG